MNKDEIKNIMRNYLIETFDIESDDDGFTDDVDFFTYGYVDSFGSTEIISFMEERFNIQVTSKDLVKYPMTSIDEISDYLERKIK